MVVLRREHRTNQLRKKGTYKFHGDRTPDRIRKFISALLFVGNHLEAWDRIMYLYTSWQKHIP